MGLIDLQTADSDGYIYPDTVPLMSKYNEQEVYKQFGARWDKSVSLWLIDGGHKNRQLSQSPDILGVLPSLLADNFYYAIATQPCLKCANNTKIYCIAVKFCVEVETGHELDSYVVTDISYLFHVDWKTITDCTAFDDKTEREIKTKIPKFRLDYGSSKYLLHKQYYINHCEHCDAKIEANDVFNRRSIEEGKHITLMPITRRILVRAGPPWTAEHLQKAKYL